MNLKLAFRSLLRQPVFTAVVVLSLAIGIALDTTMYGVLDALMRPRIDMRYPEQLYRIRLYSPFRDQTDNHVRDAAVLSGLRNYESITWDQGRYGGMIVHGRRAVEAYVDGVAPNFFDVTGSRVLHGRTFVPSDEHSDVAPVVITDRLVEQMFESGEDPIGARITIDRRAHVVVGVVSAAANFPRDNVSIWRIAPFEPHAIYARLVRLRPGAKQADAERELAAISTRLAAEANVASKDVAFRFHEAADAGFQVQDFHRALILAVIAVLIVACANVANIQLARGIGRRREIALRSALGASQQRLIAFLLAESGILVVLGLALGLVGSYWGSRLLTASIPNRVGQYIVEPQFSWRVLVFSLVATTFCLLVVGLIPAMTVSRVDPNELLKAGAGTGATKRNRRFYGVLVAAEIGLALALTSGSAVLLHSWMKVSTIPYNFDTDRVSLGFVGMSLSQSKHQYSEIEANIASRLHGIRGVEFAGVDMQMGYERRTLSIDDGVSVREVPTRMKSATMVSPEYLRTLGLRMIAGRDFVEGDQGAVIVDERTARYLWQNKSPVGAMIKLGDKRSTRPYHRVIGVVSNLINETDAQAAARSFSGAGGLGDIYCVPGSSETFSPRIDFRKRSVVGLTFAVRAKDHPERMPTILRQEMIGWPEAIYHTASSWDEFNGTQTERDSARFVASLFTLFAALGVGLAAFGVYGVVAHSVAERRRELGVRIALGASSRDILHSVLRESVVVGLAGTATGLLMTKYSVILLKRLLIEDEIFNAPLFAAVALLLAAIAAGAAFIPAHRATRIDPTESLRNE